MDFADSSLLLLLIPNRLLKIERIAERIKKFLEQCLRIDEK